MKSRAQAAVIDGIMFLLVVVTSVTLVYSFYGNYGQAQDKTAYSAFVMNFMQATVKTLYYLDASTLSKVDAYSLQSGLNGPDCGQLQKYPGISVMELLKKDSTPVPLTGVNGDGNDIADLDNKFGKADAPGKLAMRCAMKELMKPFEFANFKYLVEIVNQQGSELPQRSLNDPSFDKISNDKDATTCEAIPQSSYVVSTPFLVMKKDVIDNDPDGNAFKFTMRFCVWQK